MNFRPLPPSVQDAFDATIADLLEDSTIFAHADRNFIEKLEAAMALCSPHFHFPGLNGNELVQMQRHFALKQVIGTLLLSPNGADLEWLNDLLAEYLHVRPWARKGLGSLCRALQSSTATSRIGSATPPLLDRLETLDRRR
jgi:hypothetical protein